jgi:hypothetical protein
LREVQTLAHCRVSKQRAPSDHFPSTQCVYPLFGFAGVFGATTLVLLVGALAVLLMGVPTRGRSLEDIAAEQVER